MIREGRRVTVAAVDSGDAREVEGRAVALRILEREQRTRVQIEKFIPTAGQTGRGLLVENRQRCTWLRNGA
jgi:hypothetical protein